MQLKRAGSQPSIKGPEEWFTGTVRIDPLNAPPPPARVSCASVTFEPGARTAWHTHPLGQTLLVTAGCGWTQCEGEPRVEIRAGDVIWCPPGHKHWHGATSTTAMTHIAIQEALDGKNVNGWSTSQTSNTSTVRNAAEPLYIRKRYSCTRSSGFPCAPPPFRPLWPWPPSRRLIRPLARSRSRARATNPRPPAPQNSSPVECGSIRCGLRTEHQRRWRPGDLRAWRALRLAHPSRRAAAWS